MGLNSAWQIDEYHPKRAGIDPEALARGLLAADEEVRQAQKEGRLAEDARVLRIAVWHHAVTGNDRIQDLEFLGLLAQAGFLVCLHGDVHEDRPALVNPYDWGRRLHIEGAGSFAAPADARPESTPRLYNLLEIARDRSLIRVHTRMQRSKGGEFEGYARWPGREPYSKVSYHEIQLS